MPPRNSSRQRRASIRSGQPGIAAAAAVGAAVAAAAAPAVVVVDAAAAAHALSTTPQLGPRSPVPQRAAGKSL